MKTDFSDPLAFLRHLAEQAVVDDIGLLRAVARCLAPEDAATLLRDEATRTSSLRDALLRKVVEDAEAGVRREHHTLVRQLLRAVESADGRTSQILAYSLSSLCPTLPRKKRRLVQEAFVRSRFVGIRRRGYRLIGKDKVPDLSIIVAAWREWGDPECAWLLVKLLPAADLASMKSELLPSLDQGWMLSRLFLRLAELDADFPDELERLDSVSYCYVLAKLGRTIPNEKAMSIVEQSAGDERFGLLVWSIGKMGLWEVLVAIQQRLPELEERRFAALMQHDA
ncbi:hypothetical protein EJP69_17560 [Variovorax gossypii]|uniref:HEAT repeat domain-containing protein n=1 Tax=Variovorax gossypii TaxID=1679495 RepID=A0A431TJF2_9BURK|nr:hypothetical protein [Variovorax gossypii]RTQ33331.1 hypothetical protein EJP69_17560 [Variovorax gossypii]